MPQPLSKLVKRDVQWTITLDAQELRKQPELAALASEVIGKASSMDFAMGRILVHLLHASPPVAFSIFSSVTDAANREKMILAAAKTALAPEDFERFRVVYTIYRRSLDARNKLAHWIWGSCNLVQEGLLLVDPRYLLTHTREYQQARKQVDMETTRETHRRVMETMVYDFDKIYVYRAADFESLLRDFDMTLEMIGYLEFFLSPEMAELDASLSARFDDYEWETRMAREKLETMPIYQEALTNLRNKKQ